MESSHPPIPIDQQSLVALNCLSPQTDLIDQMIEFFIQDGVPLTEEERWKSW
jgi:hypothetical protein